jgi:putative hydrolase of the HAD superfamily
VKAVIFDLGDTLVEYEGLPLSWVEYYPEALSRLAAHLGAAPNPRQIEAGQGILRAYNTRLHPRLEEISFRQILSEIARAWSVGPPTDDEGAATAFFSTFRQRLRPFPDSGPVLSELRRRGMAIGVFTDVPYGMPRSLVLEDIRDSGLEGLLDQVVTSGEAGFRKPSPVTLRTVAERLGLGPADFAYVGNEAKDAAAARAYGCRSVVIDRAGAKPGWNQDRTLSSLADLLSP